MVRRGAGVPWGGSQRRLSLAWSVAVRCRPCVEYNRRWAIECVCECEQVVMCDGRAWTWWCVRAVRVGLARSLRRIATPPFIGMIFSVRACVSASMHVVMCEGRANWNGSSRGHTGCFSRRIAAPHVPSGCACIHISIECKQRCDGLHQSYMNLCRISRVTKRHLMGVQRSHTPFASLSWESDYPLYPFWSGGLLCVRTTHSSFVCFFFARSGAAVLGVVCGQAQVSLLGISSQPSSFLLSPYCSHPSLYYYSLPELLLISLLVIHLFLFILCACACKGYYSYSPHTAPNSLYYYLPLSCFWLAWSFLHFVLIDECACACVQRLHGRAAQVATTCARALRCRHLALRVAPRQHHVKLVTPASQQHNATQPVSAVIAGAEPTRHWSDCKCDY